MKHAILAGVVALGMTGIASAQTWNEVGDAGQLIGTAQTPIGSGPLEWIHGTRSSTSDVDIYRIYIANPAAFGARTAGAWGQSAFDTMLALFSPTGMGIVFNDDAFGANLRSAIGPAFSSASTNFNSPIGSPAPVYLGPGEYYLAISGYSQHATSAGGLIWSTSPFDTQRGPNGPGAGGALSGWTGTGGSGAYTIELVGATFIPAPGALALLGLAGLCGTRRRRA